MNDLRVIRSRHQDVDDLLDRLPHNPPDGARSLLVTTTTDKVYPTTAGVFYTVVATDVDGPETEGSTPTFSPQTDKFVALNIGTGIPPSGTVLLAEDFGIWIFRYDG